MDGTIALMLLEALLILLGLSIRFISPSVYDDQPVAVDDSSKDDVILTQVVSPPSSRILVSPPTTKYDVFLNFRGEDTRDTFASYLNKALQDAGIQTFMDKKLRKGEQILPVLLRAIEESQIYVIIFSENYASSTWCMHELVHISECQKKFGRVVIPIFYNVDPSDICKQKGSFGNGFNVLKQRFKDNQEQLNKWTKALIHVTNFSGWNLSHIRPEVRLLKKIVKDTLSKLACKSSYDRESLVGIDCRTCEIEALISTERIVGIWGMGGVGKTTLAKAIFHKLKDQFDACCFIENVMEQLAIIGLAELQKNCLKELLEDEDISNYDIRSTLVKCRLQRKKILLVLDDVDCPIRAKHLTEVCDWFGEGSRIIITTRDIYVLVTICSFSAYHVSALNFEEAFRLFSLKAFNQYEPPSDCLELSYSVVDYSQGNPLVLVVLGCFLCDRGKEEWKSALNKLRRIPCTSIIEVLKLSFDGLDNKQKDVFLEITFCSMKGGEVSMNMLRQLYGSSVNIEINVLAKKSLISFNHKGYIVMHDLVREMGFEISRQELLSSPKSHSRLWRHRDIYDFFTCGKIPTDRRLSCASSSNEKQKQKQNNNDRDDLLLKAMGELDHKLSKGLKEASECLEMHIDRVEREKRLDGMKKSLYVELMKVEGLTDQERASAYVTMISDDSILIGFYAMPQEAKVDVIRQIIA